MEVKELQELIECEKFAEEKVRKAREEAQEIVKKARENAESAVQAIEADPFLPLGQAKREETERKKAEIAEEYKRKISELNKTAERNFEKAVSFVTKEIMRVST